jgi:hypothetical protein
MDDDWKNDPKVFSKMFNDLLNAEPIEYGHQSIYDSLLELGKQNIYANYQQPKIIHTLYKREDILIEYHEKDKKYTCEYIPLDIIITIPEAMLVINISQMMHDTYYGLGMQSKNSTTVKDQLAQVCSRIVFAIKNFGPTLNAIHDRIEETTNKKLDIPWTIRYIKEETNIIESPDWEIMERA